MIIAVILVAGIAHALNMFHYPYYENDEGTYISQAWSLVSFGKLAPYTYTYDHAPGGWLLVALWSVLLGGFSTFGFSINTGRVLVLLLFLFSCLFLYLITRKITDNPYLAALSVLFFSLSPLGIYFQRRLLLDNIMIFWLLFSLYLIHNTRFLLLSGLFYGISLITKENSVFFLPAFLYLIYSKQHSFKSLISWSIALAVPVIIYFGYALSRGEFFPYGSPLGGQYPHVSLISAWQYQLNQEGGSILDINSSFWQSFRFWLREDPLFVILGMLSLLINCYFAIKNNSVRIFLFFALSFVLFLVRGGRILQFYILPLVPFIAINMTLTLWQLSRTASNTLPYFIFFSLLLFANLIFFGNKSMQKYNLFTSDQIYPQLAAYNWIINQSNPSAFYAIDNYAYLDLNANKNDHLKYAEYYWKVDQDPDIRDDILQNDWRNINYILATPQLLTDASSGQLPLVKTALDNSQNVFHIFKDGWGADIYQVTP